MMTKAYPVRGAVYTLRQILETLELRDMASLGFLMMPPARRETDEWRECDDRTPDQVWPTMQCIQTSHCKDEQLLAVPGFADSLWEYVRETHEWIPVFKYVGEQPITDFVDLEPLNDKYFDPRDARSWWVTPKGLPRQQFYDEHMNETGG